MRPFPLMLLTEGRTAYVVGDGDLADAKARLAFESGLNVVRLQTDKYDDLLSHSLAFVVLETPAEAARCARALKAKGCLVNVADQPGLCDFILPSIVDRSPVLIAVSTGGASATMARQIRTRLEADLPESLGPMVEFISSVRNKLSDILQSPEERRHFWDWATTEGHVCDPFSQSQPPEAGAVIAAAMSFQQAQGQAPHQISILELLTFDPADISLRALRRLQQADLVLCLGLKTDLHPIASLARRDAAVLYDEISGATIARLARVSRSVILLPTGATLRAIPIDGARFEFIQTGKVQL